MKKPMKTLTGVALGGALSLFALSANAWWGGSNYYGPWGGGPWYGGYPYYGGYGWGGYPGYGWGGYPGYGWGGYPYGGYGWGGYPYGGYGWGGYPYRYGWGYPAVVAPVQPAAPEARTAK
jgi:hypothetical protein